MIQKQQTKCTAQAAKRKGSVTLGSENPICKEAQEFIDEFKNYVDNYTLFIIKDSFCGFNEPTQQKMVQILQYVFNGMDIENAVLVFPSTGIQHLDILLSELIYKINISMDNFAYYER
jgi:hypothetical protein